MMRLFRLLLLAGVLAALWAWLREFLEKSPDSDAASAPAQQSGSGQVSAGGQGPSKADLYREAQKLGVEGRSKMTKDELAAAVARARQATPA